MQPRGWARISTPVVQMHTLSSVFHFALFFTFPFKAGSDKSSLQHISLQCILPRFFHWVEAGLRPLSPAAFLLSLDLHCLIFHFSSESLQVHLLVLDKVQSWGLRNLSSWGTQCLTMETKCLWSCLSTRKMQLWNLAVVRQLFNPCKNKQPKIQTVQFFPL